MRSARLICLASLIATSSAAFCQAWMTFGGDSQHSGKTSVRSLALDKIVWHTKIDLNPPYSGPHLLAHYGSPVITAANTVVVPVKTGETDYFKVYGRSGATGAAIWSSKTSYTLPPHGWYPSFNVTLVPGEPGSPPKVAWPESGGRIAIRSSADSATATKQIFAFYTNKVYKKNPAGFDANVKVCTPLTYGADGSVYFGYIVLGDNDAGLSGGGLAKIDKNGVGSYLPAATLSGDPSIAQVKMNGAPAINNNGSRLYITVCEGPYGRGKLVSVDTATFTPSKSVFLIDPHTLNYALVDSDGTSSPMVGPDGDVYCGVLENGFGSNHYRGWSLHFTANLKPLTPGAFGWDNTPSVVPSKIVPFYTGSSTYLLFAKYNNYAGAGNGLNNIAVLDPHDTQVDPISGVTTMKEIAVQVGPTVDPDAVSSGYPDARKEWCVNAAVVDVPGKCILANSEDGYLYRWDLVTNTLSEKIRLTRGIGEAYTCTLMGPDGRVYAVNNAILFAVGSVPR
jgi:hypothetical protein